MTFSPATEFTTNSTGATARTWGSSSKRSPILTGMGACVRPMRNEAPGGCTRMSAPTPSIRLALSFTSPWQRPTTRMTIPTSMATARMLTAVRMGRCRILEMINLLIKRVFLWLWRAQVYQLRPLGFLQVEFLRGDGLIESGLFNGDGNLVVILRPVQFDVGWIANTLKILIVGVLDIFSTSAIRLIELRPHQLQVRAVEPRLAPQDYVPVRLRLNNAHHEVALGGFTATGELFPIGRLMVSIDGGNNERLQDVLRTQVLQCVLDGMLDRGLADNEFLLAGNVQAEFLTV